MTLVLPDRLWRRSNPEMKDSDSGPGSPRRWSQPDTLSDPHRRPRRTEEADRVGYAPASYGPKAAQSETHVSHRETRGFASGVISY